MEIHDLFEILVREHADTVRAFLLASVRDPSVAEDLLQDTFLTAWRTIDRYDRKLPFGPWVRGIAGNLLLNHRRKVGRSKVYFCDAEALAVLEGGISRFARLRGDTFDEKLDVLRECLGVLSNTQSRAITLHYEHGLHCKEIARRLGIGLEAVKKHLQRGRAVLHRCMTAKIEAAGGAA